MSIRSKTKEQKAAFDMVSRLKQWGYDAELSWTPVDRYRVVKVDHNAKNELVAWLTSNDTGYVSQKHGMYVRYTNAKDAKGNQVKVETIVYIDRARRHNLYITVGVYISL